MSTESCKNLRGLLRSRRTVHSFLPEPIPDRELLLDAIETACQAPNHHLTEPWRYYVLGEQALEELCCLHAEYVRRQGASEEVCARRYKQWRKMPAALMLGCRASADPVRGREDYAACCCAMQNLMLALWEQGVASKWSTSELIAMPECHELIGIDAAQEEIVGLLWCGYAATIPKARRSDFRQFVNELP
ncbi:MAG: nitroreductase family protein [Candidatus Eutrophobiaceae bacterium]